MESSGKVVDCETFETLDAMELLRTSIAGATSLDAMLAAALDAMLDIFGCQRAWLFEPILGTDRRLTLRMERTRPEYPGALELGTPVDLDEDVLAFLRSIPEIEPISQVAHDCEPGPVRDLLKAFSVKSQLAMQVRPRAGEAWILGIHHCEEAKEYESAVRLFQVIGRMLGDTMATLRATENLRQSEERFRTLVEQAPEAIVIFDCEKLAFVDANPLAQRLFGLTLEELQRTGPVEMSPKFQSSGELSEEAGGAYIKAALDGAFPHFEWEHKNSSGDIVPCEIRLARLPHPTRPLVRGSISDISERLLADAERRELQEHLHQAQKMEAIGNLTGGVAHDFNNLLTVISGTLDLVHLDLGNESFVRAQLAQIRAAAERASSLTHRLLAFARKQPLQPTNVDPGRLLADMRELLERTLGETITLKLSAAADAWLCTVDATQLENAVLNLAINARDAMPEGGVLEIRAKNAPSDGSGPEEDGREEDGPEEDVPEGDFVMVSVSDQGTGMTDEVLEQMFAPFFTTKEVGKGSGLGLSMVYGFVKQSGGHIRVASELGTGSSFSLYLPRAQGKGRALPEPAHADEVRGSGQRILVVEDEEEVRSTTCALLHALGYQTVEASRALAALEILEGDAQGTGGAIELLLTDVVLAGGMDGAELVRLAKRARPRLRVLFMSGYSENAITRSGQSQGSVRLLPKPFTKRDLARRVAEALSPDGPVGPNAKRDTDSMSR